MNELNGAWVTEYVAPWGLKIIIAIAIFVIGRWLARLLSRLLGKALGKAGVDDTLRQFLQNIAYGVLLIAVILAALDGLGVNTTSLLAVLGAAGLAVGLALKDSLANFAAGVMLLIFRPFRVGDYVDAGGSAGTVDEIGLFATLMRTPDNQRVIVPNSAVAGGTITNVNALGTRRLDLVFGIAYEDDMNKALALLQDIVGNDARVLNDPAPSISVGELADSSVNFNVRPWVQAADYWGLRADLLKTVKETFDQHGISIPYPQQDVHYHGVTVNPS